MLWDLLEVGVLEELLFWVTGCWEGLTAPWFTLFWFFCELADLGMFCGVDWFWVFGEGWILFGFWDEDGWGLDWDWGWVVGVGWGWGWDWGWGWVVDGVGWGWGWGWGLGWVVDGVGWGWGWVVDVPLLRLLDVYFVFFWLWVPCWLKLLRLLVGCFWLLTTLAWALSWSN